MLAQTREQRFSVHHLTNLGGLVALAGRDLESPDLLLGALPQMADVLANCSADQRPALASRAPKSSNNEREASASGSPARATLAGERRSARPSLAGWRPRCQ
jgi:Conjugal transfer protein TraD